MVNSNMNRKNIRGREGTQNFPGELFNREINPGEKECPKQSSWGKYKEFKIHKREILHFRRNALNYREESWTAQYSDLNYTSTLIHLRNCLGKHPEALCIFLVMYMCKGPVLSEEIGLQHVNSWANALEKKQDSFHVVFSICRVAASFLSLIKSPIHNKWGKTNKGKYILSLNGFAK